MKYKYLGSGQCDLKPVKKFTLKYATLTDLNDPYEATLSIPHDEEDLRAFVTREVLDKPLEELLAAVPEIDQAIKKGCPSDELFKETMSKKLPEVFPPEQCEQFIASLIRKRHQTAHTSWEQKAQKKMSNDFGILCLSDTCESYLMWSHYANKHQGYCIGFDEKDPWFAPLSHSAQGRECSLPDSETASFIGCLREVEYHPQRQEQTKPSGIADALNPYFWKSEDWDYEKEHRMLYPLDCSDPEDSPTAALQQQPFPKLIRRKLEDQDTELYLRKFHPSLIKEIVFGVRCSLDMQTQVRSALTGYNVSYFFAIPSSTDYTMKKEPAHLDHAYDPLNPEIIKKKIIADALQRRKP